jgi:hypothetical protein
MQIEILKIARHRNGIGGAPFHVVLFLDPDGGKGDFAATVFEAPGHVSVLNVPFTAERNIEMSQGNSWRGDYYEERLRNVIADWERQQDANFDALFGATP